MFASLATTSCDDDEIEAEETSELITEITLDFSSVQIGSDTFFVVRAIDADGDGNGLNFVFNPDTIELRADSLYKVKIGFGNITKEIFEEANEHQIFYTGSAIGNALKEIDYKDTENSFSDCIPCNGSTKPVGITTVWSVGRNVGATGIVRIRLKHQPNGLKNGSVNSGEDDVNLIFSVKVI